MERIIWSETIDWWGCVGCVSKITITSPHHHHHHQERMESKNQVNYERLSLITGCGFFGVFTAFTTAQSLATSLPGTFFIFDDKTFENVHLTR